MHRRYWSEVHGTEDNLMAKEYLTIMNTELMEEMAAERKKGFYIYGDAGGGASLRLRLDT